MRFLALIAGFAAAAALAADPPQAAVTDPPKDLAPDPFTSLILQRLSAEEHPTCVAVGIVASSTRVAFGCTKSAGPVKYDRDSVFEIGSVSKAFTGVVLADMVQRGEVALTDPVSNYAPKGAKIPSRNGREITLKDLVTHTSGLPRLPVGFQPKDMSNPYASFTTQALYDSLAVTELQSDPGAKQEYSNLGFMLLSDVLGRRAGKSFDRLLEERVLKPLFMVSTGVRLDEDATKRLVKGHNAKYEEVPHWDILPSLAGVGGLRSSLIDMLRFAEAASGRRDSPLDKAFALSFHKLLAVERGTSTAFAWGVRDRGVGRIYFHNGETGGFHAMIAVNPDAKTAAVVLVDSATSLDDLAMHLVDTSIPTKVRREAIALDPAKLDDYVGLYVLTPEFSIRVFREGNRLMTQATNQGPVEIFAEATQDHFFVKAFEAQLVFKRGSFATVESLTLIQGGRELAAKKAP
ncbi:serine hydrolase [Usitatibacter palustris]|uniref:Beta-lactamase n=1 Tax=Usitatibacter palustris TaxID=2732487 RepID=A0A6M4HBE3_9PROT|nr:serine hydrolase [Usitatibacter palustris]QJR15804.1 D-aminopeptidase [Usitatibacter palustris]